MGIKPESHKSLILCSLPGSTAVALSLFLSIEDTAIPDELQPAKCQELEPCNCRIALATSILFDYVCVCACLATALLHAPDTHCKSVPCLPIYFYFFARAKTRSERFSPSISLYMSVIRLFKTLSATFYNSLRNTVGTSLVAGYRILYFLVCPVE